MRRPGPRKTFVTLAVAAAALLCGAAPASARDAIVTSFDGTPLVTHFFASEKGGKAPTVLLGHGWGGTGDNDPNSISAQDGTGVLALRRAGFNVLTWDSRGFGGSGGTAEVDSKDFEGRDVQALIDYVARQPEAKLDSPGDPRLGMTGGSYAGGIELVAAGMDRRIDAIAPIIAWNSLVTSLYKDGAVKQGWGLALFAGGASAITGGLFGPAGFQTGSYPPELPKAIVNAAAVGNFDAATVNYFRSRGLPGLVGKVRVPTLLTEGTPDTLFTLHEAIVNYRTIRRTAPVKMLWYCGGHGICLTDDGKPGYVGARISTWLRRYLFRDRSIKTGPAFEWVDQKGTWRTGPAYPLLQKSPLTARGHGSLAITPAGNATGGGILIAATPATGAYELHIPAPSGPADVVGEPRLRLKYKGTAVPAGVHIYAQLVDEESKLVLGNQATPIPLTLDGKTHQISRLLEGIAQRAGPGTHYKLQLTPASTLYVTQRAAGLVDFSDVRIDLPVVDASVNPNKVRLLVGRPHRVRSSGKGHPVRVFVRAKRASLRRVRVVLRNSRGKLVGKTKRFSLRKGRRRYVKVRVGKRPRFGRYIFRATGRTKAGGIVRGKKRFGFHRR